MVSQSRADPTEFSSGLAVGGMFVTEAETTERVADTIRQLAADQPVPGPLNVPVLILSAGGQYGAFGAGFLTGWSRNTATPRPDFKMVTGVSAGAYLAPVAFAGSDFDYLLEPWNGLGSEDVFRQRSPLALLRSPSFAAPDPLEALLQRQLTDNLITRLAERNADSQLLVSAVALESSQAQIFDLGQLAAGAADPDTKRSCMTEGLLASGAIPGLFPPRNINGELFLDGGLRDQLFLGAVEEGRLRGERDTGRSVRFQAHVVLNGALELPSEKVEDTLISYVVKSTQILADEVLRSSVQRVIDFADDRPDWSLRAIVSRENAESCRAPRDGGDGATTPGPAFDSCVTAALFDEGFRAGAGPDIPWLGPSALAALAERPGAGSQ